MPNSKNKLFEKYRDAFHEKFGNPQDSQGTQQQELPRRSDGRIDTETAMENLAERAHQRNAPDPPAPNIDLDRLTSMGAPEEREGNIMGQIADEEGMGMVSDIRDASKTWSHSTWSPDKVHQDWMSQTGENIAFGTGQVIGQYGDLFHALDALILNNRDGNMLSRALQDYGQDVMDSNTSFIPPELADPSFKPSTFLDPQFWTIHGARFVPQLVEILATRGVASGIRKGVQKGVTAATKKGVEKGSEHMFRRGFVPTTSGKLGGRQATEAVVRNPNRKSHEVWKRFITDEGQMTRGLSNAIETVAAGTLTNTRIGLSLAGATHAELSELKNPDGTPIYSDEQLGDIASSTFRGNMNYLGLDIASWAFTFGKGSSPLDAVGKGTRKLFTKAEQMKYIGGIATKMNSPIVSGMAKLAGKSAVEGLEETLQESWEEYSAIKAIQKHGGDLAHYQDGKYAYLMEDKNSGLLSSIMDGDAFEFFMSKENEATRTIAFGLGAAAGGAFNVRSAFNRNANLMHNIRDRADAFKKRTEIGSTDSMMQKKFIMDQIVEIVDDNKMHIFAPLMASLRENGSVTDADIEMYEQAFNEVQSEKDKIDKLNITGKSALLQSRISSNYISSQIERKQEEMATALAEYEGETDSQAYQDLLNSYEAELMAMYNTREMHDSNSRAALTGNPSKRVAWRNRWDENSQTFKFEQGEETNFTDGFDPRWAEAEESSMKSFPKKVVDAVKGAIKGIRDLVNPRRTAKSDVSEDGEIEIGSSEDFVGYTEQDREELNRRMQEGNANLTQDELQEIAEKHGLELDENGEFVGESQTDLANAMRERTSLKNDRQNSIEEQFLEEKLEEARQDATKNQSDIESVENRLNDIRDAREEFISGLSSETSRQFNEETRRRTEDDINKSRDEAVKALKESDEYSEMDDAQRRAALKEIHDDHNDRIDYLREQEQARSERQSNEESRLRDEVESERQRQADEEESQLEAEIREEERLRQEEESQLEAEIREEERLQQEEDAKVEREIQEEEESLDDDADRVLEIERRELRESNQSEIDRLESEAKLLEQSALIKANSGGKFQEDRAKAKQLRKKAKKLREQDVSIDELLDDTNQSISEKEETILELKIELESSQEASRNDDGTVSWEQASYDFWLNEQIELNNHLLEYHKRRKALFERLKRRGETKASPPVVPEGSTSTNTSLNQAIDSGIPVRYDGLNGFLRIEGQQVVFVSGDRIYELGNVDEISNNDLSDHNIEIQEELEIEISDDNSVTVNGQTYTNPNSNRDDAVTRDSNGRYSVKLQNSDGKVETLTGAIAEEIAYEYKLKQYEEQATEAQLQQAAKDANLASESQQTTNVQEDGDIREESQAEVDQELEVVSVEDNVRGMPNTIVHLDENGNEVTLTLIINPMNTENSGTYMERGKAGTTRVNRDPSTGAYSKGRRVPVVPRRNRRGRGVPRGLEDNQNRGNINELLNRLNRRVSQIESENDAIEKKAPLNENGERDYSLLPESDLDIIERNINELESIQQDIQALSQDPYIDETAELENQLKELNRFRNQGNQKRTRRLEERLGELRGVPVAEQRSRRKKARVEEARRRKEESKAQRESEREANRNDPNLMNSLRRKARDTAKKALQRGDDLTVEFRDQIINLMETEGVINSNQKNVFQKWAENMFMEEEALQRRRDRREAKESGPSRRARSERTRSANLDREIFDQDRESQNERNDNNVKEANDKFNETSNKKKLPKGGRRAIDLQEQVNRAKEATAKAGTSEPVEFFRSLAKKVNGHVMQVTQDVRRPYSTPLYSRDTFATAQMLTMNEKLGLMFPDSNVAVLNAGNLAATLGYDSMGLLLGTTMFIDSSKWNQGSTFMHEAAHLYFNITRNEPETQRLINYFLKNDKLVDQIKRSYWDDQLIRNTQTNEIVRISDLSKFDRNNKAKFMALLNDDIQNGFFEVLPMSEQEIWLDELFAFNLQGPLSAEFNHLFERRLENNRQEEMKGWWSWLKNRGKVTSLLGNSKTYEQQTRDRIASQDLEGYVDLMESTLDRFGQSIKGKVTRAGARFSRELEMGLEMSERVASIGQKLESEKKYVRGNQFSQSKYNKDRNTYLNKEDVDHFFSQPEGARTPGERARMAIAQKLYSNARLTGQIELRDLTSTELDMYESLGDMGNEIDNIVYNQLEMDDLDGTVTTRENRDFEDSFEMHDDNEVQLHETREKYSNRYQRFVNSFTNTYNIFVKEKSRLVGNNDYQDVVFADSDQILDYLYYTSQNSDNPIEFILQLQNNDNAIISRFLSYLETQRPRDSHTMLKSMYVVMSNMQETSPISKHVNPNGSIEVSNAMSKRELSRVQSTFEKIQRTFSRRDGKERIPKPYMIDRDTGSSVFMKGLNDSIEAIRSNSYSENDLRAVLDFFSSPSVDVDKIIELGHIVMNGKAWNIDTITRSFLMSNNAFGDNKIIDSEYNQQTGRFNKIKGSNRNIMPFLRALEATDRINTSRQTVLNANGDQVQSTTVKNALLRFSGKMENDARELTLSQFLKKYNANNRSAPIAESNPVLARIYKSVRDGGRFDLSPSTGLSNGIENKNKVVKEMSSSEKSLDDFLTFMSRKTNSTGYTMDIGRLSDSSTAYNLEVPFSDIRKWSNFDPATSHLNDSNIPLELSNAFKAYKSFARRNSVDNRRVSYSEFIQGINNSIDTEVGFMRDMFLNSLNEESGTSKYRALNQVFNKDGSLKPHGRMAIAQYVVNHVNNGINIQQFLFPSLGFDKNEVLKRSKLMSSPSFALHEDVGIETIYFPDLLNHELTINGKPLEIGDGANFILERDGQRIRDYFGNQMKVGYNMKILNAGIEMENEYFKNENVYDKGSTIELSEEFVKENPSLRPLFELMKSRSDYFTDRNSGRILFDLDRGEKTQIVHAVPMSARKVKDSGKKMDVTYQNEFGQKVTESIGFGDIDFNDLIDPETSMPYPNMRSRYQAEMDKANALMKEIYYKQSLDEDGELVEEFIGQSGSNFGVQQVLDIPKTEAMMSVQAVGFLTNDLMNNSTRDQVHDILNGLMELQQENVSELYQMIERDQSEELREFLLNNIDLNAVDQNQLASLRTDELSIQTPWVRSLAQNTISNIIRKEGNRLKTTGTIARQIPDFTYNSYTKKEGLNSTAVIDGEVRLGEAVMPKHLRGFVEARRYYKFGDKNADEGASVLMTRVEEEAINRNLTEEQRFDLLRDRLVKQEESKAKKSGNPARSVKTIVNAKTGNIEGFYIEGDKIVATRIPSHGPQSTSVLEVSAFSAGNGYNVQLPSEFSMISSGGDFDGDQVFIQYGDNGRSNKSPEYQKKWNETFNKMTDYLMSPEVVEESAKAIEFDEDANAAKDAIDRIYGKPKNEVMRFSPEALREDHANTHEVKALVGIAASMHSTLSLFSNYNTSVLPNITINGRKANQFTDNRQDDKSRVLESAKIFNLILDNVKTGFANDLGLNMETISETMILTNLGYDLSEIAVILNSDIAKQWAKRKGTRDNMFLNPDYRPISVRDQRGKIVNAIGGGDVKTKGRDVRSLQNQANILQLLNDLSSINDDVRRANAILSGHNKLERNPFEAERKINDFKNLLGGDGSVVFTENFRRNPRVQNYLKNAEEHLKLTRAMDPVYREAGENSYKVISNNGMSTTTDKQKTKVKNDLAKLFDSNAFGLNNYTESEVKGLNDNIIRMVDEYRNNLINDRVITNNRGTSTPTQEVVKAEPSLLFNKALNIQSIGSNQSISLNTELFLNGFAESDRQRAIQEFSELPAELQHDMLLYDFVKTGWATPNSIIALAPLSIKERISNASEQDAKSKSSSSFNYNDQVDLNIATMANNINLIPNVSESFLIASELNNQPTINPDAVNARMKNAIISHSPFSVKMLDPSTGDYQIYQYEGLSDPPVYRGSEDSKFIQAANNVAEAVVSYRIPKSALDNPANLFLQSTSSNNPNVLTGEVGGSPRNRVKKKSSGVRGAREQRLMNRTLPVDQNYAALTDKLSFGDYNSRINTDNSVSRSDMESLYQDYLVKFDKAKNDARKLTPEYVKKLSHEKLMDMWTQSARMDGLSQAPVLSPLMREMVQRGMNDIEQSIYRNNPDAQYNPNLDNDINFVQRYLMSNNIPSDQPGVQYMVRELEREYKVFLRERNKLMKDLNNATDALYREKRGYGVTSDNFITQTIQRLRYLFDAIFNDAAKINQELYGPLITTDLFVDELGRNRKRIKYKTKPEIEQLYKSNQISKAQYDFYNATSNMMKDLAPYNTDQTQADYIPHTAPSIMEKFFRRGLMGVITDSKSPDQKLANVVFNEFIDPVTGLVIEKASYKQINEYLLNVGDTGDKNNIRYVKLLAKYKLKAIDLAKKNINEDGTPIEHSEIAVQSVLGSFKLNDFSRNRGIDAELFPSLDLNKAFSDYINSSLITNGNRNFKGLKQLYPIIDGIIDQAEVNKNPRLKAYVQDVWKDYFVKGRRQDVIPNNKYLEALGTSPDKIVRYGLRASTFYWLGVKGLVGGAGLYAVSNVLAGKYFNIKNQGGKSWITGEKRFWFGSKGIKLSDPFAGVKDSIRILNRIGYMDIHIYDDVAIYRKNDPNKILFDLALLPMVYSERWIQGVNLLGMLSKDEYDHLASGGDIDPARLQELENTVKKNHGKGYQPTDQRGIQVFSLGQMMMQFSRHIPTIFHDSFAKKDFNIYGKEDMGSTTALYNTLNQYMSGYKSQKDFIKFFNGLSELEKERTRAALRGFGMMSAAWGAYEFTDNRMAKSLVADVNAPMDFDKIFWKAQNPPLVSMLNQ